MSDPVPIDRLAASDVPSASGAAPPLSGEIGVEPGNTAAGFLAPVAVPHPRSRRQQQARGRRQHGHERAVEGSPGECSVEEPPGQADLLWSEGAIYDLGWAEGLRRWRPLLKPGGVMAITEATWLTDSPPAEIADFWREVYPVMGTVASNMALARQAGLGVIDTLPLSESDWWGGYFGPLQERVAFLREQAREDWVLAAVLDDAEREIALYARHGSTYGYVFYLLSVPGPT